MTVAGQPIVNYNYDANSRLTNLVIASEAWQSLSFGFTYDALGRRTSLSLPNGITTTYNYDNGSNLLNLELSCPTVRKGFPALHKLIFKGICRYLNSFFSEFLSLTVRFVSFYCVRIIFSDRHSG